MRKKGYAALALICLCYWILDSGWSYLSFEYNLKKLIFSEPASILDTILLRVPPYQVVSRLMVVFLFVFLGSVILEFIIKKNDAERKRKQAYQTLSVVLNSIDATIYVADMNSYEILFMNQKMIDSFGGDFVGRRCHEIFRQNPSVCDHCTNAKLLDETGNPKGFVVWEGYNPIAGAWYVNYDRAIRWVDGRIARLQIATDITHLKELQERQLKAEAQLRQAQKMESIGTLAGGIAHDFNNILSSIIGFTELALEDAEHGTHMEDNLQEVYTAGKRARDLVRQILVFARKSDDELKPIPVNGVVKEVLRFLRSSIPVTIDIESDIQSDSLIMGSATQVHQIVMNLCTNAAQAMDNEGGVLRVSLNDVRINHVDKDDGQGLAAGDYMEMKVADTGVGIPADMMGFVFEPYFTTRGVGEGTGMGLALVHGIVERYGGRITVESELGKGTVFTIYLPVTKKRHQAKAHEAEKLPAGTEHILFVDDEAPIAKIGSQLLERLGYSVTTRTSSLEALELFHSKPEAFDLVVTDATMPNMTGDKLAAEIMRIRPDIPVILCTGYSKKISDETARKIGIKAVAHKPIVKADLAKTVRDVLDNAKYTASIT